VPLLLAFAASFGAGAWLSAINAQYRDVQYIVPFLTQAWLFRTPPGGDFTASTPWSAWSRASAGRCSGPGPRRSSSSASRPS
jgi:hypothetical protein